MTASLPSPHRAMSTDPRWQWLAGLCAHADADWLGQEIFDILKQAIMHGDIEDLVCCQASLLTMICPAGTPTPDCWLWSWRLAYNAVWEHRQCAIKAP